MTKNAIDEVIDMLEGTHSRSIYNRDRATQQRQPHRMSVHLEIADAIAETIRRAKAIKAKHGADNE